MGVQQILLKQMEVLAATTAQLQLVVKEAAAAMEADFGKVGDLLEYPLSKAVREKQVNYYREWSLDADEKNLKAAWDASQPIREENKLICARNKVLVDKVTAFLEPLGLPDHKVYRAPTSKRRDARGTTDRYGWRDSLRSVVTTDFTWDALDRVYKDRLDGIKKERERLDQERAKIAAAKLREEAKLETEVARREVTRGVGLPVGAEWYEVMSALIAKNKYLRLAYWMERNRGDWSDGFDYARTGLNGFTVENETDARIAACIQGHIDDWDGDGRVFRDCEWNYGRLFEMAKEQDLELFELYVKASKIDLAMRGE